MTTLSQAEINAKIAIYRQKAIDGTLSLDECREAVQMLRQGRVSASYSGETTKRAKAKAAIPSADDLLGELGGL